MLYRIAFIFIFDLKLFLKRGGRVLSAALLAFAVCAAAGRAGAGLIYGKSVFEPFTVAVVDQDNSYETNVLFTNLKDIKSLKGTVSFARLSEAEARQSLGGGDIEAYVILPKGFASDFENGANTPPSIVTAGGLKSELVKLFVNSAIGQLSASQAGVYATLDSVSANAGDQAMYSKAFQDINMEFISLFFSRESLLRADVVSAAGALPPGIFFVISFFLFFCALNTGFVSDCFIGAGCARRLRGAGLPSWLALLSHTLFGMLLHTLLAASVIAALLASGVFEGAAVYFTAGRALGFGAVMLALSALSVFWFSLTEDRRVKGAAVFTFALLSLFFSGGLIPFSFLPSGFAAAKNYTFNAHAADAIGQFFVKSAAAPVYGLLVYALAAFALGFLLIRRKEIA